MKLQADLREFIELLSSHQVEFLVVGGHSVAFHGYPRLTDDLDLFVRPTIENGRRVLAVLEEFGFGDLEVTAETFTDPSRMVVLGRKPNRIDILTSISGVSFDEAWGDRTPGDLDGLSVHYLSRKHLVQNKTAAGRPQDLADVAKLPGTRSLT